MTSIASAGGFMDTGRNGAHPGFAGGSTLIALTARQLLLQPLAGVSVQSLQTYNHLQRHHIIRLTTSRNTARSPAHFQPLQSQQQPAVNIGPRNDSYDTLLGKYTLLQSQYSTLQQMYRDLKQQHSLCARRIPVLRTRTARVFVTVARCSRCGRHDPAPPCNRDAAPASGAVFAPSAGTPAAPAPSRALHVRRSDPARDAVLAMMPSIRRFLTLVEHPALGALCMRPSYVAHFTCFRGTAPLVAGYLVVLDGLLVFLPALFNATHEGSKPSSSVHQVDSRRRGNSTTNEYHAATAPAYIPLSNVARITVCDNVLARPTNASLVSAESPPGTDLNSDSDDDVDDGSFPDELHVHDDRGVSHQTGNSVLAWRHDSRSEAVPSNTAVCVDSLAEQSDCSLAFAGLDFVVTLDRLSSSLSAGAGTATSPHSTHRFWAITRSDKSGHTSSGNAAAGLGLDGGNGGSGDGTIEPAGFEELLAALQQRSGKVGSSLNSRLPSAKLAVDSLHDIAMVVQSAVNAHSHSHRSSMPRSTLSGKGATAAAVDDQRRVSIVPALELHHVHTPAVGARRSARSNGSNEPGPSSGDEDDDSTKSDHSSADSWAHRSVITPNGGGRRLVRDPDGNRVAESEENDSDGRLSARAIRQHFVITPAGLAPISSGLSDPLQLHTLSDGHLRSADMVHSTSTMHPQSESVTSASGAATSTEQSSSPRTISAAPNYGVASSASAQRFQQSPRVSAAMLFSDVSHVTMYDRELTQISVEVADLLADSTDWPVVCQRDGVQVRALRGPAVPDVLRVSAVIDALPSEVFRAYTDLAVRLLWDQQLVRVSNAASGPPSTSLNRVATAPSGPCRVVESLDLQTDVVYTVVKGHGLVSARDFIDIRRCVRQADGSFLVVYRGVLRYPGVDDWHVDPEQEIKSHGPSAVFNTMLASGIAGNRKKPDGGTVRGRHLSCGAVFTESRERHDSNRTGHAPSCVITLLLQREVNGVWPQSVADKTLVNQSVELVQRLRAFLVRGQLQQHPRLSGSLHNARAVQSMDLGAVARRGTVAGTGSAPASPRAASPGVGMLASSRHGPVLVARPSNLHTSSDENGPP